MVINVNTPNIILCSSNLIRFKSVLCHGRSINSKHIILRINKGFNFVQ